MDLLDQLRLDYDRFPEHQSYHLYADGVYFKDPLNEFVGVQRYQTMISSIARWLRELNLQLHHIDYATPNLIKTRWTLRWVAPLPWRPSMQITGRSELTLNEEGKICRHIDYWDCSRLDVFKQLLPRLTR